MPTQLPKRRSATLDRHDLWTTLSVAMCGLLAVALWCVANRDMRRPCWSDESGFVSAADLSLVCR